MSIIRKCCPICGGRIIVSDLYQVSYDYTIIIDEKGRFLDFKDKAEEG